MRALVKALVMAAAVSTIRVGTLSAHDKGGGAGPSQADWDRVIAGDREMVASGLIAPEDVDIDIAMSKLALEAADIRASGDAAKKEAWKRKAMALMTQKADVDSKWLAAHPPRDNGGSPDPCLSASGKNICGAPPPPSQPMCSVNYGSTVGLVPC